MSTHDTGEIGEADAPPLVDITLSPLAAEEEPRTQHRMFRIRLQ